MSSFACKLCGATISDSDETYTVFGHLVCEKCKSNIIKILGNFRGDKIVKEAIYEDVKKKKGQRT